MVKIAGLTFKSFFDYYQYVMQKYFRKHAPVPDGFYLSQEIMEDMNIRMAVARNCHFPSLITTLANDEYDQVRKVAYQNEFWKLLGRFQDVLDFGKRERLFLANHEDSFNLITLLMFERDLDVFTEILKNPFITINMMELFLKLLKQRSKDRIDEQMLEIVGNVISIRKEEDIKVQQINQLARQMKRTASIEQLIKMLSDEDPVIRKIVISLLNSIDPMVLRKFIYVSLGKAKYDTLLQNFIVLTELIHICKERTDLNKISVSSLGSIGMKIRSNKYRYMGDFFMHLLTKKRIAVVKSSEEDVTDFSNVILLSRCHLSKDRALRSMAEEIMAVNLILNLVNDISTPKKIFTDVLSILEKHPDENVKAQVEQSRLRESERLKESLKELEISVQAYFDIIFQSLGYNQINEYKNVVKSIEMTDKQIRKFENVLRESLGDKHGELNEIFHKIQKILNTRAKVIYFDTSQKTVRELEYILSLIDEIFRLKEFGLKSLRPGSSADFESEVRSKASAIWRSAISFYLGRIKDLSEMIQKKIAKVAFENERNNFELDIDSSIEEIEGNYKKSIDCNLKIACAVCSRRGCAAERFLFETRFFISKFLDGLSVAKSAAS
ncbi:MAG TPA: hypothetical protein ENO27_02540 [Caldithrix sp.]|nr:hypothetical protein [Calditrichaceae bacterium]HEM49068.1 hypothetical protein [Caldithrix sp.]